MIRKYNSLGKLCIACVVLNLIVACVMLDNGSPMAILNVASAFLCHLGSFSDKCRK